MADTDISQRLRALASDDRKRPETARLRDIFNDIEATLKAGISQIDVLNELHAAGFTMKLASFKSALQRIRKERSKSQVMVTPEPGSRPSPTPSAQTEKGAPRTTPRITNPGDLNKAMTGREIVLEDPNESPTPPASGFTFNSQPKKEDYI